MAAETSFGKCKCCLKETYLKNMWYTAQAKGEVFGQMLVDCFSIDWMIQGNIEDDKICEACISKLRVAVTFKNQVLQSQAGILSASKVKEVKDAAKEKNKEESIKDEEEVEEEILNLNGNEKAYEDVEFLEEEVLVEETNDDDSQDYEPDEKKPKWPRKLPPSERYKQYRQYTEDDLKSAVDAVENKKLTTVQAAEIYHIPRKTISKKRYDNTERPDIFNAKELLKAIRAILLYTNATPFRIKIKTYNCYFCPNNAPGFEDPKDLRAHTHSEHYDKVIRIEFAIRPHHLHQMVRFDIENLTCCDCDEEVTWSELLEHLGTRHNVNDIQDAWKKIVPYTLTECPGRDNPCALCDFSACFSKLDTHMNIHFENFICGDCGKPFVTSQRLKSHEFYHELGEHRCEKCNVVFPTQKSKRQHINTIHEKKLLFKCNFCPERFVNNGMKLKHLKAVHQDKLESDGRTCRICNKSFWSKEYWTHMRQKHSTFLCVKCSRRFASKNMLDKHVCKQGEVTKYQCDLCFKLFFTVEAVLNHKISCGEDVD